MNPVLFVIIAVAVFVALYLFWRKVHPKAGTMGANATAIAMLGIDYLNNIIGQLITLPWHDLLDEAHAKMVILSVMLGNVVIRALRKDPAPPSA